MGHRCGYVAIPHDHPAFGKSWDEIYDVIPDLDVDGGVTFACLNGDTWVLGWDAAHSWHLPDVSIMSDECRRIHEQYGSFREPFAVMIDADMAEAETRRFAQQLAEGLVNEQ
ncbi:MAG: hypothetical protein IJ111_01385 [Eggerthellaceae bacterium]|nr:hypothetical protein [Eggerthellaceae bacterium]